jgi:Uma2 family endonuclease
VADATLRHGERQGPVATGSSNQPRRCLAQPLLMWLSSRHPAALSLPMMQPARPLRPSPGNGIRHVRPPRPLAFAAFEEMPETKRHLLLRTALLESLEEAFASKAWLGSDQFVYWDAGDDDRKLAPDVLVRLGGPDEDFDVWKTWERGAPHLCVEIVSRSDRRELPWAEKLARYRQAGVEELVRFDDLAPEGQRFRVWDRVEGDLVERALEPGERPRCRTLKLWWLEGTLGPRIAPRLARDAGGEELLLTPRERARAATEALRLSEQRAEADAKARRASERRARADAKARLVAEQRARADAEARQVAEQRATEEARGRADAEQRVVELEHRLAELEGKRRKTTKGPARGGDKGS